MKIVHKVFDETGKLLFTTVRKDADAQSCYVGDLVEFTDIGVFITGTFSHMSYQGDTITLEYAALSIFERE